MPENLMPREPELSSTIPAAPEYDQSKTEAAPATDSSQHSVIHTSPAYSNFGLVPQMLGNQFATVEGAEPQARDVTRIPSFLVSFYLSLMWKFDQKSSAASPIFILASPFALNKFSIFHAYLGFVCFMHSFTV